MINKTYSHIMSNEIVRKLRERYPSIHSTFFILSLEKATSFGNLFDILDTFPKQFPVEWCLKEKCWVTSPDLFPSLR